MRLTTKIIGYILVVSGLIRLFLKTYIIRRIWDKGLDNSGIEFLFIPLILIAIGLLLIFYKKQKPDNI